MNNTILITGASSGIGRASAIIFQKNGWNVIATMRSPEKDTYLQESKNLIKLKLDVCESATIDSAIRAGIERFGSIGVLLNNAGYGAIGVFEKSTEEQIRREFDVNVFGLMNATKAILPNFRERRDGLIINTASIAGHVGFPLFTAYNASKFAVEGFTESLALELAPFNIRVKLIEPGVIKTDFYTRSPELFVNDELSDYKNYEAKVLDYYQKAGDNGAKPELVAAEIFKAASDGKRKMRYPIGGNAGLLIKLKRYLPISIVQKIIKIEMKLK